MPRVRRHPAFALADYRTLGSGSSGPIDSTIDGEKTQLQAQITIAVNFNEPALASFEVVGCLDGEWIGVYMLPVFATFFDPLPDELKLTSHGLSSLRDDHPGCADARS